jgi:hypothetical protein
MTFDLILIALAIALYPLPLTAFILVLSAADGTRKGAGFLGGWTISFVGIVVLTLVVTGGKPPKANTVPSTGALIVRILVGLLLLVTAWSRHRTSGRPRPAPRWMSSLDRLNIASAAGLAFLLQPWGLIAAGAATVTQADLSKTSAVVAIVAYCLIATLGYAVMEIYAIASPEATQSRLSNLRAWLDAHRDPVIVALSFIVGSWLIGKSAYLLAT